MNKLALTALTVLAITTILSGPCFATQRVILAEEFTGTW